MRADCSGPVAWAGAQARARLPGTGARGQMAEMATPSVRTAPRGGVKSVGVVWWYQELEDAWTTGSLGGCTQHGKG